ncbi:hypothetical protein ABZT06_41070 [Streptomyces sp. NPDC005483]|uniref:hypothetical protein n=1 Tax=Streptomyces sp. NPDC005483 TaxID=3154882 RepID=UPI0033AF3C4E
MEISAPSATGDLTIRGMTADLDEELAVLPIRDPGDYPLRLHALGQDTAVDLAPTRSPTDT